MNHANKDSAQAKLPHYTKRLLQQGPSRLVYTLIKPPPTSHIQLAPVFKLKFKHTTVPDQLAIMASHGEHDLLPEQTEGFKVGEKKTMDEYDKLGMLYFYYVYAAV